MLFCLAAANAQGELSPREPAQHRHYEQQPLLN
jgi:hypothetical protein